MKFRVLGCSGGQVLGHNLSGLLIDDRLLIDAGSATAALALPAQEKITDVLITHIHLDHVLSLGLLADNRYGENKASVNIWSTDGIVDGLKIISSTIKWPDFNTIKGPTQRCRS
jgi:ribonuclease BN (tRNA processing enzyme)